MKERQKRRHTWTSKQLRKHRFYAKGLDAYWYWNREKWAEECQEKRRVIEKNSLHNVVYKGYDEEECYFPTAWRSLHVYYW